MKNLLLCVILLTAPAAFPQASVPATPTLHANADFKGLQFDWAPAAGASWYQLEYRAHQTGSFTEVGDDLPADATYTHFSFPLHLFDWTYARYRLAACNAAGCSRSTEVSVSTLRRDAVGYIRAAQPTPGAHFGTDIDISPNGYDFVTVASREQLSENGTTQRGRAVYLFRRGSDGNWVQRAHLLASAPPVPDDSLYMTAAISANANTVAVGMPNYQHQASDSNTGEVQVFSLGGSTWTRTFVPRVAEAAQFGAWVALNDAGTKLAVGMATRGANSAVIYQLIDGSWKKVRTIPGALSTSEECLSRYAFSRDGSTLVQTCHVRSSTDPRLFLRVWTGSNWASHTEIPMETSLTGLGGFYFSYGLAVSANGDTIAAQMSNGGVTTSTLTANVVNVYERASGTYAKVAELTPGAWSNGIYGPAYGQKIVISGDGQTIGVGDSSDIGRGFGPRAAPLLAGDAPTGAVYVYRLSGSSWKLANMVKPNRDDYHPSFGEVFGLSRSGKTLIVGLPWDGGREAGIGGDWRPTGIEGSGSVFMY